MPRWPKRPDYIIDPDTGCWIWQKAKKPSGYGNLFRDGKWWIAHRYYYTQTFGHIPDDCVIDHLCKNTSCVNPDHLEAVSQKENLDRGNGGFDNLSLHYDRLKNDSEYKKKYGAALVAARRK